MALFSVLSTSLVAGLHGYIFILESFLWTTPTGRRAFKLTPEFALQTRTLAANQGVYNGFLAAGLVWSLLHPVPDFAKEINLFFLGCVGVAGLVGGATANRRIMAIQTAPALVAAVCTVLGW